MRHRIDISSQARVMLKSIAEELQTPTMALSTVAEMCIQAAYDKVLSGEVLVDEFNPVLQKLDEIHSMLQEVLPEV